MVWVWVGVRFGVGIRAGVRVRVTIRVRIRVGVRVRVGVKAITLDITFLKLSKALHLTFDI